MNSFTKQREGQLLQLLNDPQLSPEEAERQLAAFVESEVRAAFIRGLRHGQKPGDNYRGASPRGALRAGRLRPARQEVEEGA